MTGASSASPFKFLEPFTIEDRPYFYGRDDEIDSLYQMVFESSLILVYGPSGSGKTSLIQCGLASRFQKTDWFDVPIRRRSDINTAIWQEIRKKAVTPIPEKATLADAVESLFLDFFKPVYLIFDQFEELYILGSKEEQQQFIAEINRLIKADLNCKIIIVIREEYLGQLYEFEKTVTRLFDKRLRVEPMSYSNVDKVIRGSAGRFDIQLDDPDQTIRAIIDQISDGKSGVQLSYLQVYLDRLYREALL